MLMLCFAMAIALPAHAVEKVRNETRSFAIAPGTEIQIVNKYGNIHLTNWNKDSVRFEITMTINANKADKVDKIHDGIGFEFTPTSRYVVAKTVFKSSQGTFIDEMNTLATTLFTSTNRVQIDYKVYLPQTSPLVLENKFGHIFMTDYKSKVDIILSNGDLRAGDFTGNLNLKIDFGSINIKSTAGSKINAGYANVEILKSGRMEIESRSSTFELGTVESLELNSRRDKIRIAEVGSVRSDLSFTSLRIDNLTGNALFNSNYGDLNLRSVARGFTGFNLIARYTEVSLNFQKEAAFNLKMAYTRQTSIATPGELSGLDKKTLDEKAGIYEYSGAFGTGRTFPVVDINLTAGQISLTRF